MSPGCQRETTQTREILHTFYREAGTTLPLQSKDRDVKKSIYPYFFFTHPHRPHRPDMEAGFGGIKNLAIIDISL